MEEQHEAAYDHKTGASSSADQIASTDIVVKEEHDEDITARPISEIEEHNQMKAAIADTCSSMQIARGKNEVTEIEEIRDSDGFIQSTQISSEGDGDDVYVAVGESKSSFNALSWALKNAVKPGSWVYLIHVFPEVHEIPTLCKSHSNNLSSFIWI
jgi:hypothetical protein